MQMEFPAARRVCSAAKLSLISNTRRKHTNMYKFNIDFKIMFGFNIMSVMSVI